MSSASDQKANAIAVLSVSVTAQVAVTLGMLAILGGIVALWVGLLTGGRYLVWKRMK
jgi:hypothetical protein